MTCCAPGRRAKRNPRPRGTGPLIEGATIKFMGGQPQPRLTPTQYLEIERAAEFRHEYCNGRIYAMAGTSYRHGKIVGNISAAFHDLFKGRPGDALTTDLRTCVSPDGLYTYPDMVVVCG